MKLFLQSLRMQGARMLLRNVTWRPDLKVWRHWMRPGLSWIRLVSGSLTRSKIIQLSVFARTCVNIGMRQGRKGLVLYLKVCNTALMQALPGGFLSHSSRQIGKVAVARSRNGLPRIIPAFARREILRGNTTTIRLWLTFFGLYRILPCKGAPKFSTILNPGRVISDRFLEELKGFIRNSFLVEIGRFEDVNLVDIGTSSLERPEPFVISKASSDKLEDPEMVKTHNQWKLLGKTAPQSVTAQPTAFAHRIHAAYCWTHGEWAETPANLLENYLKEIPGGYGTTKSLWTLLLETAEFWPLCKALHRAERLEVVHDNKRNKLMGVKDSTAVLPNVHPTGKNASGRLALLEEPAGKVRVVALLDVWSQWALKPLHNWIFDLLRSIPQDGTFDQLKPVKTLLGKVSNDTTIYSYDLSAATDRLPVIIQELLLAQVFGESFAKCWRELLVGRPYWVSKRVQRERGLANRALRYAVGQPMGGYSSWAMLALTHHLMVQFSAYRAGIHGWFTLYAVLGDDIVIADCRVAKKYRALCRLLGVEIGLNKSLVSKGRTLEFAKKLFFQGEDISGLPLKFWAAAQSSSGVACALISQVREGTLSNAVRALGAGFKVCARVADTRWELLPRRVKALAVSLTHPFLGSRFAFKTWTEWVLSRTATSKGLNLDDLYWVTPYMTAVDTVLLKPAEAALEDYQEDLFFTEKLEDPVTRLVDSKTNKAIVEAEKSLGLMRKSAQHLQGLNIKLNLVQISAIVKQLWKVVDKVGLVPLPSTKATVRAEVDPYRLKVTNMLRHFEWIRSLAKPQPPEGSPEQGAGS
jgi:hypothetical protein